MTPPRDEVRSDDKVPDPELSPTTNPILAQNLGLWAQVYYTTPPEQRDQAVQKLLEELKGESSLEEPAGPENAAPENVAPRAAGKDIPEAEQEATNVPQTGGATAEETVAARNISIVPVTTPRQEQAPEILDDSLVCPACLHKNRLQQRFCGLCGFPLKSSQPAGNEPAAAKKGSPTPKPPPPPAESFPPSRQIERSEESWDWLREKNTTAFDTSSEHSGTWKYIALVAGALVLLLVASIWWAGSKNSPPPAQAPATEQSAPAATPEQPSAAPAEPAHSTTSASTSQPPNAPAKTATPIAQSPGQESSAMPPAPTANPTDGVSSDDDGTAELIQARRYLEGQGVPRDSREASRWLWKAVAKKNGPAVLLLSDLYAHGDGVSRSCDQARVLLSAAAQRGSTEAAAKLVSLRQTVCP